MKTMSFSMLTVIVPLPYSAIYPANTRVALVTGQIGEEIDTVSRLLEKLYGVLNEESLVLR